MLSATASCNRRGSKALNNNAKVCDNGISQVLRLDQNIKLGRLLVWVET
jgi:hypothetical protein